MPRVQPKSLTKQELQEFFDEFLLMIAGLETREEVRNFFRDLLSETELLMLARRIRIAKLLLHGTTYQEIQERLHAGEGTIAAVHRWLQSGFDKYKESIPRLERELEKKVAIKQKTRATSYSFEWLKKRYPLHFLLFNIFDESGFKKEKRR